MSLVLSTVSESDALEYLAAVRVSDHLRPWMDPPESPAAFDAYLDRSRDSRNLFALARRQGDGALVGFTNLLDIQRGTFLSAYLAYGVFFPFVGRGYARQMLSRVIDFAFGELALHRLEANIQPTNIQSIQLVQRLGFELEGCSHGYMLVDGEWRDHLRYAIRAEKW